MHVTLSKINSYFQRLFILYRQYKIISSNDNLQDVHGIRSERIFKPKISHKRSFKRRIITLLSQFYLFPPIHPAYYIQTHCEFYSFDQIMLHIISTEIFSKLNNEPINFLTNLISYTCLIT